MHLTRVLGLALLTVGTAAAAERLYVCGWELQTTRAGVETDPGVGADGGTFIDASPAHGGAAVARAVAIAGQRSSFRHFFETSTPAMYARVYVRLEQPVNAETMFLLVRRSSAVPAIAWLTIDPQGRVRAQVWVSAWPTTVTLSLGVWHRFDIYVDERGGPGTDVVQIALDGQTFVLAQNLDLSHVVDTIEVGLNVNQETASTGVMLFDDVAVNGTAGADETGFPPPGSLFLMRPNGPGTPAQWTPTDGGAASIDNWRSVSELPPDDALTALESATNARAEEEYDVEPAPPAAAAGTVSLVSVGTRFVGTGTTNRSIGVSLRSAPGGTQLTSPGLAANSTVWRTNRNDGYLNLPLVAYRTPEGPAWSAATLDTLRIGLLDADSVARAVQATSVWAMVEVLDTNEPPPPPVGGIGPQPDGGVPPDAGVDAGVAPDAGVAQDGGVAPDGGVILDGGFLDGGVLRPLVLRVGCDCTTTAGAGWIWAALLGLLLASRRR